MQKVMVLQFCDRCWKDDQQETPASWISVLSVDGLAMEIALCDNHVSEPIALNELQTYIAHYGNEAETPPPRNATSAATGAPRPGRVECLVCRRFYKNRASLATHTREAHGTTLAEVEIQHGTRPSDWGGVSPRVARMTCDLCDFIAKGAQGLAAHRRFVHGVPGKRSAPADEQDALTGVG